MATYTGTPGDDSMKIGVPYENPGVVDIQAYGYGGNDSISVEYELGYFEDSSIRGGVYSGQVEIHGGEGNDSVDNGFYPSYLEYYPPGVDGVVNKFYGEGGDDTLAPFLVHEKYTQSGGGIDYLYGGIGSDTYRVVESNDHVIEKAGEGTDAIRAVFATSFENDTVFMPHNVEDLILEVDDWGCVLPESLAAIGNDLNNRMVGNEISNELKGAAGSDTLFGGPAGADYEEWRGPDSDTLRGGTGNDMIYGGRSDDDREDGPDTIYGDDGNDNVWAGGGNDTVYGGTGDDNLYGQSDNDTIYGGTGDERVYGGTGNDKLYGDDGVDALRGSEGLDQLSGGTGNDRYDYDAVTDSKPGAANRDVILDYNGVGAAVGDRIDLSTIDANPGVTGNQAFAFKGTGAITGPGQVHVAASGTNTLIQANTGGSTAPELEILVKDGAALPGQWVAGDFIL